MKQIPETMLRAIFSIRGEIRELKEKEAVTHTKHQSTIKERKAAEAELGRLLDEAEEGVGPLFGDDEKKPKPKAVKKAAKKAAKAKPKAKTAAELEADAEEKEQEAWI